MPLSGRAHADERASDPGSGETVLVSDNPSTGPGQARPWATPIRDREWVDEAGTHWHMRGQALSPAATRRLLKRADVRTLHVNGPEPRLVTGDELDGLNERLHEFLTGKAPDFADFRVADFRDGDHHVMAVVEEYC